MAISKNGNEIVTEWIREKITQPYLHNFNESKVRIKTEEFIKKLESKFTSDLNDDFRNTIFEKVVSGRSYNLLNIAITYANNELFDWCIDKNFDPCFFPNTGNRQSVTAIGLSAYIGNIYTLNKLVEMGVDPLLIAKSGPSSIKGGTLLHRIMGRSDIPNKIMVIQILAKNYENIKIKTESGKTAWDLSIDNIGVDYLLEKIAKEEKQKLLENMEEDKKTDIKNINSQKRL